MYKHHSPDADPIGRPDWDGLPRSTTEPTVCGATAATLPVPGVPLLVAAVAPRCAASDRFEDHIRPG